MRKLSKILALALILMIMLPTFALIPVSAAGSQPEYLYLKPNSNWTQSNARFAAYFFGNGETWVSMTDHDGNGIYEVKVPEDKVYPSVIFCRMNSSASANNWDNKWNQTGDLTVPTNGNNCFTVPDGAWDGSTSTWSKYSPVVTVVGTGTYLGGDWTPTNTANDMTFTGDGFTKVYENVDAGSYKLKCVLNHAWTTSYGGTTSSNTDVDGNYTFTVAKSNSTITITLSNKKVSVKVEHVHIEDEGTVTTHPSCDGTGIKTFKCAASGCSDVIRTEAIDSLGHTPVVDTAVDATCTEAGKTEGSHCSACGGVLVAQTVVDALGHSFNKGTCGTCGAKDPDYVAFSVPDGVAPVEMGEGDVLPTAGAPEGYTFAGWSETTIDETTTKPTILAAGSEYTGGKTVLYAVYKHEAETTNTTTTSSYNKVTSAPSDWSGTYLIVYETDKVAFNGGLATLDAVSNNINVTISNNSIASNTTTDAAAFTIAKSGSNYTIKSASGYYIGQSSNANGLNSNKTTTYANTISINSDGSVNFVSGGAYLRYNAASNQLRFRYYKSTSYTGQKAIYLYKLETKQNTTTTITVTYLTMSSIECDHNYESVVTDPTCTAGGYTTHTCTKCGDSYVNDKVAALDHSYNDEITTPATCTTAGVKTSTCETCGDVKTASIAALGHSYADGKCSTCGEKQPQEATITFDNTSKRTEFSTTKQVWVENGIVITNTKTNESSNIGDYSKPIRFYQHSIVTIAYPNMTKIEIYCNSDDYATNLRNSIAGSTVNGKIVTIVLSEVVDTYPITLSGGQVRVDSIKVYAKVEEECTHENTTTTTVPATCLEAGSTTVVCDDCGETVETTVIPATGHNHSAVVTAPTCTTAGYTTYTCACGDTYIGDEVAALGHTAGAEATCTTAQTCTVCGTELVAALGHTAGAEATCTTAQTCTVCGTELVAALGHTEEVVAGKDATCTEAGLTEGKNCSVCGETLVAQEEIPATGHKFEAGEVVEPTYTTGGYTVYTCNGCGSTENRDITSALVLLGTGTEEDPFVIDSLEALIAFRDSVNSGDTKYNAKGVYVALGANIDMSSVDWSVNIGDDCNATFDGIFDGKNYTISNLNATETAKKADGYVCGGLFGAIYGDAVIKNLVIENVSINTGDFTGNNVAAVVGFVYEGTGSIENVTVCGNIEINASGIYGVGAIVGYSYYGSNLTVKDCKVVGAEGSYINASSGVGAISGYTNSVHAVDVEVSGLTITANGLVGGIFGVTTDSADVNGAKVSNVTLVATKDVWVNSTGIAVGTVSSAKVTVAGVVSENVTGADTLVGSNYADKPTTVVPAIEAQIGNTYYTTLQGALDAAVTGDTVVLLKDIKAEKYLDIKTKNNGTIARDFTLDLNGYSISPADGYNYNSGYPLVFVGINQTLTIKGEGTISAAKKVTVGVYGILNLEGGTIVNTGATEDDAAIDIYYWNNDLPSYEGIVGGTGYITGGNVQGNVHVDDPDESGKATLVISGGTFTDDVTEWLDEGLELDENGTVIVHIHSYTSVTTAPTCTTAGYTTYTCACGHSYVGDTVEALGHDYDAVVTAPTVNTQGYTTHTCTRCGDSYVDSYVDPIAAVVILNGVGYETFAEALEAAKTMTGDVVVEIYSKVTLNTNLSGSFDSIKFVGKGADAEIYLDVQGYVTASGKKVYFEDLQLSKVAGGYVANAGFMNLAFGIFDVIEVNYTNCTFLNGAYASSGNANFTNCTFYRSHDRYGMWAYGDVNIVIDGCTFADIRGIKMYDEAHAGTSVLTVKNTDFTAADNKPAIVLTYGNSVTLEGNTYSSKGVFELDLDGAPNGTLVTSDVPPTCVNDNGACGIIVDGKIYTTVAQAAAVATSGSTVTLLHDTTETVEFAEGVVFDKNGHTADGVTVKVPDPVAQIGEDKYFTFEEAVAAVQAGQTIILLEDVALTDKVTLPAGITLNGNGKYIDGEVWADGDLTFEGYTKIKVFNAGYNQATITIGVGATLEMTSGRMVIGHGATFNIVGNIVDAKSANVADLTPSLIIPGASFTGAGVNFNVTNAYVKFTAYCSSKNSSANGTFNINVTNSIWEQSGSLVFSEPTNGKDPTVNLTLKDSVLNSTSHLVFAVTKGEIVFDNSNVNVGANRQLENRSTLTIKNGSVVYAAHATSSNAKNPGTTIVDNATYICSGEFSGSDLGIGTIIIRNNANVTLGNISKANVEIDATSKLTAGKVLSATTIKVDASNVTETVKVIDLNNNASIEGIVTVTGAAITTYGNDGDVTISKAVAQIGNVMYGTLQEAINAAVDGDTITLINDVVISGTTINLNKSITIDGNGYTLTHTEDFAANGSNAMFDIMGGATVTFKNLTIDGVKNAAVMRTVDASVVIDNCTIQNCEQTVAQGLLRLACGNATITNSKFLNNKCTMVVSFGYDAGNDTDVLTIDGCTFEGNTCGETAVVYFNDGDYAKVTNTKFIDNTVTATGNAATLYMGWGAGFEVSGCLFDGNVVTTSHATTKRFASAIFADGCVVENNVFLDNTAIRNGETINTTVAIGAYYGAASVSGNYWNGGKPTYTVEYTRCEVEMTDYYTSYDVETGKPSGEATQMVAKVGKYSYATLQDAINAANGETVVILADINLTEAVVIDGITVTLDLNGHTINAGFNAERVEVLLVKNNANVTITGNGTMLATGEGTYVEVISAIDGAKVTIENGTFVSDGCTAIYATRGAIVTINGGYYEAKELYNGMRFLLDINEAETNKGVIVVNGGSFKNFNPANHNNDGANSNKLADGLHAMANVDNVYVVAAHAHTSAVVTAPTCTEVGYTTYTCACGDSYTADEVAPLGHDMIVDSAVAPTCTATGLTEGSHCSRCDYKVEQTVVDTLGHDMIVDSAVAPTCTATGLTEGSHCSRCDHKVAQEIVPATGHSYSEWVETTAPTCTTTGLETHTCSCGASETREVAAKGHTSAEAVVENRVEATCTVAGSYDNVVYCTTCGAEISRNTVVIPVIAHTPSENAVVENDVPATCTTAGSYDKVTYCSVCNAEITREAVTVEALGHDIVVDAVVAPTCTETGLTEGSHCSRCDDMTVAQEEIPATGHTYTESKVEPTCTEDGYTKYECECGDYYVRDIVDALGHSYDNGVCTTCGDEEYSLEDNSFVQLWQVLIRIIGWFVEFFKKMFAFA